MSEINSGAQIGAVTLRVADLVGVRSFYREAIGLRELEDSSFSAGEALDDDATEGSVSLAAPDADRPLLRLIGDPAAAPRPGGTTGLFHLAILVPSRLELARSLARLITAGWRLTGASDHLVSEALYLNDPEGNGIEIYRDRPREEWRRSESGELAMATLPLDLQSVIDELNEGDPGPEVAAGTTIGHVHLNVADLERAEGFYSGELGFDVMVRGYPGALFVAAGGYHHHIGLNTWNGEGAPPPPAGARGLDHFEVIVPGLESPKEFKDPSGNRVRLV